MKTFKYLLLIISIAYLVSCSTGSAGKTEKTFFIENGDTLACVMSQDNREYHIWTMGEVEFTQYAKHLRSTMNLDSTKSIYFHRDSTLGNESYYASFYKILLKNEGSAGYRKAVSEFSNSDTEIIITKLKRQIHFSDINDVRTFISDINDANKILTKYAKGSLEEKIKESLQSFQKKHFPMARKAYYNNAKNELWEKNIEVSMSGRDITFTGHMFIDNKVKKDTYLEVKDELAKLRFKSVGFRAFDGDDKTYWELDSKKDNEI